MKIRIKAKGLEYVCFSGSICAIYTRHFEYFFTVTVYAVLPADFRPVQIRFKTNSLPSCNHGNHKQLTEQGLCIINSVKKYLKLENGILSSDIILQ